MKKIKKPFYYKKIRTNKLNLYDWAGHFPDKDSAEKYANEVKNKDPYHLDRLRSIKYLLKDVKNTNHVLDYGIGDGREFVQLKIKSNNLIGIDISPHIIEFAKINLLKIKKKLITGGVETIKNVKSNSQNLVIAINVMAYLTDKDLNTFFKEVNRVLKKGGSFLCLNGNELFDLFSLNNFTSDFFIENFNQKKDHMDKLLKYKKIKKKYILSRRFNPINFKQILKNYNLIEVKQSYSQWHRFSPEIGKLLYKKKTQNVRLLQRDNNFDANKLDDKNKWKAIFCCSIFGSLSIKS